MWWLIYIFFYFFQFDFTFDLNPFIIKKYVEFTQFYLKIIYINQCINV